MIHRRMMKSTIKKFEKYINIVFDSEKFLLDFKGEINIAKIMTVVADYNCIERIMLFCDKNRYFDSFKVLFNYHKRYIKFTELTQSESLLIVFEHYPPTDEHLDYAIKYRNIEIVKILLQDGRIRPTDKHLNYAIKYRNIEIVMILLQDDRIQLTDEHLDYAVNNRNNNEINAAIREKIK
ncbi:MAG: DUF3447 domain-containing protein [Cetobacterium sp.]